MPYVHLANGDVKKVSDKELNANHEASGSTKVFRENGTEHHIIGVYPEEYEYQDEETQAENAAQDEKDRADYEAWKKERTNKL